MESAQENTLVLIFSVMVEAATIAMVKTVLIIWDKSHHEKSNPQEEECSQVKDKWNHLLMILLCKEPLTEVIRRSGIKMILQLINRNK